MPRMQNVYCSGNFIACNESNAINHANVCYTQDLCLKVLFLSLYRELSAFSIKRCRFASITDVSPQSVPRGFCERKIKFTQALCLLTYSSSNLFILSINQKSTYDFHRNSKANVNTFCHPYTCTIITHLNENLDQGRTEEFG